MAGGAQGAGSASERLLEALEQVACARADRRAWESGHTTIFELLRRSCLDASNSGVLETLSAEDSQLEDGWLFLLEERRLHPIRKRRVKECAHAFGATARWLRIFRESTPIREALHRLDPDARMELLEATSSQDLVAECSTPQAETAGFAQNKEGAAEPAFTFWSDDWSPHTNSLIQEAKAGDIQFSRRNPFLNRDMPADETKCQANRPTSTSPKGDVGRATLQAAMAPESLIGHVGKTPQAMAAERNPFRVVRKVNGGSASDPWPAPGGATGASLNAPCQCRERPRSLSNPFLPVQLDTRSAERDSAQGTGSSSNPFGRIEGSGLATAKRQSGNNPFSVHAQRQHQQQPPTLAKEQPGPTANPSGDHVRAPWPSLPRHVPTAIDSGWA